MNVEPDEAFRLSFLTGIFAAIAAFGLTILSSKANVYVAISAVGLVGILVAILVSIVVSLFLIDFLIRIARRSQIVYLTGALGVIAIVGGAIGLLAGISG